MNGTAEDGYVQLVENKNMKKLIFLLFLCCNILSCQNRYKNTPKDYVSNVKVRNITYTKDSLTLVDSIRRDIIEHIGGFHSKSFDNETKVIIDTIMYSPNKEKIFFFVITKVENRKLYPIGMNEGEMEEASKYSKLSLNGFHYKGKGYVAFKKNGTITKTKFYGITTSNYENIENVRQRQRQIFFKEFSAIRENGYEYNVNDKRFWDNKNFWDKMNKDSEVEKE